MKKSGRQSDIKRIELIIKELSITPRMGIGHPERLKYQEECREIWSRKINKKDRLIYEIIENQIVVEIIQAKGHYDDK